MGADPLHDKIDEVSARIRAAEGKPVDEERAPEPQKFNRAGVDFVGAVLGCVLIGWCIDRYFDTGPWGLIVMIFVGFAVGMVNVWKAMDKKE